MGQHEIRERTSVRVGKLESLLRLALPPSPKVIRAQAQTAEDSLETECPVQRNTRRRARSCLGSALWPHQQRWLSSSTPRRAGARRRGARAGGGDRKGRGVWSIPFFRKTQCLPGQLLRSPHKLQRRPSSRSAPLRASLASPKLQLGPGAPPGWRGARSGAAATLAPGPASAAQPPLSARAAGGSEDSRRRPGRRSHAPSPHPLPLALKRQQAERAGVRSWRQEIRCLGLQLNEDRPFHDAYFLFFILCSLSIAWALVNYHKVYHRPESVSEDVFWNWQKDPVERWQHPHPGYFTLT
ncbi:uncharacterized protein [Equus przewalskii]|uniref:Uncharacterized protein n=1 Tax=Equus przewalskii TaxID=9798 RepID=A0ABM4NHA5_EQUPR